MCFSTVLVLVSDIPLYLWLVWFGTGSCFWICLCTYGWSGSALITIPRISPVLTATSVRHGCSFPDIPLYLDTFWFGTHATFRNITCTHGHFGSALAPLSGILPVLIATSVRHSRHFPESHLYSTAFWFGTDAHFRIFPCTHIRFCSALVPFSRISPVLMTILFGTGFHFRICPVPYSCSDHSSFGISTAKAIQYYTLFVIRKSERNVLFSYHRRKGSRDPQVQKSLRFTGSSRLQMSGLRISLSSPASLLSLFYFTVTFTGTSAQSA